MAGSTIVRRREDTENELEAGVGGAGSPASGVEVDKREISKLGLWGRVFFLGLVAGCLSWFGLEKLDYFLGRAYGRAKDKKFEKKYGWNPRRAEIGERKRSDYWLQENYIGMRDGTNPALTSGGKTPAKTWIAEYSPMIAKGGFSLLMVGGLVGYGAYRVLRRRVGDSNKDLRELAQYVAEHPEDPIVAKYTQTCEIEPFVDNKGKKHPREATRPDATAQNLYNERYRVNEEGQLTRLPKH